MTSQLNTMDLGTPYKWTTSSKNWQATLKASEVWAHDMKWAIVEKRSPMTITESCYLRERRRPNTKSILTSCNGLWGTNKEEYRPDLCFFCFASWQVQHCSIMFATSLSNWASRNGPQLKQWSCLDRSDQPHHLHASPKSKSPSQKCELDIIAYLERDTCLE